MKQKDYEHVFHAPVGKFVSPIEVKFLEKFPYPSIDESGKVIIIKTNKNASKNKN